MTHGLRQKIIINYSDGSLKNCGMTKPVMRFKCRCSMLSNLMRLLGGVENFDNPNFSDPRSHISSMNWIRFSNSMRYRFSRSRQPPMNSVQGEVLRIWKLIWTWVNGSERAAFGVVLFHCHIFHHGRLYLVSGLYCFLILVQLCGCILYPFL